MIFVFETRYSGWPIPGEWVACIEDPMIDWVEPYVEELIGDVTAPGDEYASHASDEINRRCYLAGGDTPEDAFAALLKNPDARNALNF